MFTNKCDIETRINNNLVTFVFFPLKKERM